METTSLLEEAESIAKVVGERAGEIESRRAVPADVVDALAAAGFFRLYVPRSLGGCQADPLTAFRIFETLSAADASTGWTTMILNTSCFTSWLEPAVARELLSTAPGSGMAGTFAPFGKATVDGQGTLRLRGRWPFNSGAPHASWFCEGAMVMDADGPRVLDDGRRDWRFVFLPADDVEILDTWYATGLRGTASHHVAVNGAAVPDERTANPIFTEAPHDAPHFRWPFFSLLASLMVAFPVGVARRALDEFTTLANTKARGGSTPLAQTEHAALSVARAEGAWRGARAFAVEALEEAWAQAEAGDRLTHAQRVSLRMAAFHAMRVGIEVVDTVFALAGGAALYDDNPLQRCWRDLHAGSHHLFFSDDHAARTGRALLAGQTDDWAV